MTWKEGNAMKTPETSKLFKRVTDQSGVGYYVLKERVCAFQQGFYFVNNSMTLDGRYLWFYATVNPIYYGDKRCVGFIDFLTDELVLCTDVMFDDACPYIDNETGDLYFTCGKTLYKRAPVKEKMAEPVCAVPINGAVITLATHLTRCTDKKRFFLDINRAEFGFIQGLLNIETGAFTKWSEGKEAINHGQINPRNDSLALCAIDSYSEIGTGISHRIPCNEKGEYMRLWTVDADGKRTMYPPMHNYATHEWWSADGKKIYYVNDFGIYRINIETGVHECAYSCRPNHAFTTKDEQLFVFDEDVVPDGKWYRGCPARVRFYNARTGKEIVVVEKMPETSDGYHKRYHLDAHPRFTDNEKYIVFTTTAFSGCDLAIASVEELRGLTE